MNSKSGQMSSAFSYIFAIIIGGIIFMFLIGFAYQYISLSGSLDAATLVTSLNDEFAAFSVSESAEKIVDYNRNLEFSIFQGELRSAGQSDSLDQIIFSPFELEGRQIFMATRSMELPYRVGNVFYLADGRTYYVLVYDASTEEVADDLKNSFNSLPKNFPSEVFSVDQVSSNIAELAEITAAYDHVRFVFFTSYDTVLDDIAANFQNYDVLRVSSQEEDYSYGTVEFPDGEVVYLDFPLLIGALVTFNAEQYKYNFDKVIDRLSAVTGIYLDKSRFVSARLVSCDYAASKATLESYSRFIGSDSSAQSYKTQVESVENANNALGGDCPEIF